MTRFSFVRALTVTCVAVLCMLILALPVGGTYLYMHMQQHDVIIECAGQVCVYISPGDIDVWWD